LRESDNSRYGIGVVRSVWSNPASPVPKPRQIYAELRAAILEGPLGAADALPSTRQVASKVRRCEKHGLAAR